MNKFWDFMVDFMVDFFSFIILTCIYGSIVVAVGKFFIWLLRL